MATIKHKSEWGDILRISHFEIDIENIIIYVEDHNGHHASISIPIASQLGFRLFEVVRDLSEETKLFCARQQGTSSLSRAILGFDLM